MRKKQIELLTIGHYEEYPVLKCKGCTEEFILLQVFKDSEEDWSSMKKTDFDYCPWCGSGSNLFVQEGQLVEDKKDV